MTSAPSAAYALLDEKALQAIEQAADHILAEVGIEIQDDPETLAALADQGGVITENRVRIRGGLLRERIASAPRQFIWRGNHPDRDVTVGGDRPVFAPSYGTPNAETLPGQRGLGTLEDYQALVDACEQSTLLDSTGFLLTIAHDRPEETRHLDMARLHLTRSTKPMMGTIISDAALRAVVAESGARPEPGACRLLHMINATPPLVYQANPLRCLRAAAELGQGSLVSSYMMMGATAPTTLAGCLAQGLAEVMLGLALTQIWRPGVPVVGGLFAIPFSMQYMGPIFGGPESQLVQMAGVQLVHRLGVPARGDGMVTSSKINDAQAGYDGANTLGAARRSGADLILHTTGWLEAGRTQNLWKFRSDEAIILGRSPQTAGT